MKAQVDDLRRVTEKVLDGGPDKLKQRHKERKKMLVRDRIDTLIDKG
jgi:acetyl-CoA carboxylase carboxyltransferase component